ncbi:hypothetical protein AGDE_00223 [Angomonas deanei]|uniref:Uncharacterized protein n=1 Tax=Angomonas deanei TaxID=59799 RepID=S9VS09_9TRYP|nr:hypothetical protein AGDE_05551 [Angomonas deanei]EPY41045.1 hypothetical protein AGDE_02880 [Angomonas deanei]EPY43698.1 hypothetical protein AGDE_00223 [Angomonas deanei]CAD2222445.1 hypothetical protein, conserved [Angomonas deanei]|eukprot:EPY38378.1 hypothetical protein AGDE_05551 [Angomonas deanei]
MLASALRRGHSSALSTIPAIKGASPVLRFNTLKLHAHKEGNFRVKPMGWKAWNSKQFKDPFAPFELTTPTHHLDRPFSGAWFGFGHFALKNFFGPLHWKFALRLSFWGIGGLGVGLFTYGLRMHRNGWEWKNRGAVFSMD